MSTAASLPEFEAFPEPTPAARHDRGADVERPGVLRGNATLTVHTRQAQRLVRGRAARADKPAIIGLIGFATVLRNLWHGARADDPYADWWLLRVHEALNGAQAQMTAARTALGLEDPSPITLGPATSVKPVRIPLAFSNAYAFRGAWLLATYDALVCAVLTARHVGVLTREEAEWALHQAGRCARRAFSSPFGYSLMGVTRRDVEQCTVRAQQAQALMGALRVARSLVDVRVLDHVVVAAGGSVLFAERKLP